MGLRRFAPFCGIVRLFAGVLEIFFPGDRQKAKQVRNVKASAGSCRLPSDKPEGPGANV